MFFLILSSQAKYKKPVILVPGTYASVLTMKGQDLDLQWYCPKTVDDEIVWIAEKYFIPPVLNCVLQWINLKYDPVTNSQVNIPGVEDIDVLDFGGLEGITYLDRFGNFSFISYFTKVAQKFLENGYVTGQDLFGAPNDWRKGIADQKLFYGRLTTLVESAYNLNGKTRVVLLGHSFGSFAAHDFLTNYAKPEWCEQYIDHSVMLAPSFGGSPRALDFAWKRAIDYAITIKLKYLSAAIEALGAVHTHFPNYELSGDTVYAYGPDGVKWTADRVPELLVKYNKIQGDNIKLLDLTIPHLKVAPKAPTRPEFVYYNSQIPTAVAINISDYSTDKAKTINGRGDSTIMADTIETYCNLYNQTSPLYCHDINIADKKRASHFKMILDDELVDVFYNAAIQDV